MAHYGYALSRGRLARDLMHAHFIQDFPIQLVHGDDSALSCREDVKHLAFVCRRAGFNVHDVSVAGSHALWHSLPDVAALAQFTLQAIIHE